MTNMYNDDNYQLIVRDILRNEEFEKIQYSEHHGTNRLQHSLRVSYMSYCLAKFLHLDYVKTARAGLLHDFFYTENDRELKDRVTSTFSHPKVAAENASKHFQISEMERNIIESHMYGRNFKYVPKYMESWLVIVSDTLIGLTEFGAKFQKQLVATANLWLILVYNAMK